MKMSTVRLLLTVFSISPLLSNGLVSVSFDNTVHWVNKLLKDQNRFKRNDDDTCAINCAKDMKMYLNTYNPELIWVEEEMRRSPISVTSVTKEQFRSLCQNVINPATACFSTCHSSSLITVALQKASIPGKFACDDHYQAIYDNYECLQQSRNVTKEQCDNDRCKKFSQAPLALMRQSESAALRLDYDQMKKLLADNCEYVGCTVPCEKLLIQKFCNENVAKLMEYDLVGLTIETSKEIMTVSNMSFVWPDKCDNVLRQTGYLPGRAFTFKTCSFTLLFALLMLKIL